MNHVIKIVTLTCIAASLSACGWLNSSSGVQTRDQAYLQAKSIPPLRIPPGLASSQFENRYPVSDRNDPDSAKTVSLVPPGA